MCPDSAVTALMWVSGNGEGGRGWEKAATKHQPPEWVCTPTALLHVGLPQSDPLPRTVLA